MMNVLQPCLGLQDLPHVLSVGRTDVLGECMALSAGQIRYLLTYLTRITRLPP